VIPLFHRLRLSPVLGFMLVGVAVGPFGLAMLADHLPPLGAITLNRPETIAPIAELGISMMMFMIGLELSLERLRVMRRLVFGFGLLQFVLCAVAIAVIAYALGAPPLLAVVAGPALSMSSTAVVVQVLSHEKRLGGPVGRTSLGVLLLQDIAAVPVLFAISVFGAGGGARTWALVQAIVVVLGLIAAGRLVLRPLFRGVARTGSPELFVAACLLVILATGLATAMVGLPMELGSLIAGLLLAETEFRRQIEVTIDPFKGLLLGVFLISVGMSLDLAGIAADAPRIVLGGVALVALKLAIVACLARAFGLRWLTGLQAGLLLGPGGEFGFVILNLAHAEGLIGADVVRFPMVIAAATMACIPLLSALGRRMARRTPVARAIDPALLLPQLDDAASRVIIAGFGRVGETVASLLERHRVAYVAVDTDADRVAAQRKIRRSVYWAISRRPSCCIACTSRRHARWW
jgi:CPA2 family monovalent cation:H+ antiporter-2